MSSGCIRLTNEDVEDLYSRVQIGAKVIVLPQTPPARTAQQAPPHNARMTWNVARPSGLY